MREYMRAYRKELDEIKKKLKEEADVI